MIRRAEAHEFDALIITVDLQVPGARYRQQKHSFSLVEYHKTG